MDGSCIAQIFPSRKLNVIAHTLHANIHTDINIIYTHTHTNTHTHTHTHTHTQRHTHTHRDTHTHAHTHACAHTHIMVRLDLWKCPLEKESFELVFEVREGGEIPQAGTQRIPDSWNHLKPVVVL